MIADSRGAPPSLALSILLLALAAGCAAPRLRVEPAELAQLAPEHKLLLFDAESGLDAAIDGRDQVVEELRDLRRAIRRAQEKRELAERDRDLFADKGDGERAKIAALRADAEKARRRYLEARVRWAEERLAQRRRQLVVAKAELELARARLVVQHQTAGAPGIAVADFERQVERYAESARALGEDVAEAAARMAEKEAEWQQAQDASRAAGGAFLGARWLD